MKIQWNSFFSVYQDVVLFLSVIPTYLPFASCLSHAIQPELCVAMATLSNGSKGELKLFEINAPLVGLIVIIT